MLGLLTTDNQWLLFNGGLQYIMGWHVPFTPGIIPKEKGCIAEAIGGVISENLMNKEVLEKYFLSEDMIGKFLWRQNQSVQLRLICIDVCPTSFHRDLRYRNEHY